MRTRVKFCGLTRACDAQAAVDAGCDAVGFVFHRASARFIEPGAARDIIAGLPPFVCSVGLFVDAPSDFVSAAIADSGVDLVQFHGDESPDQCRAAGRPYIKAVRMRAGIELPAVERQYADARALLLDTYQAGVAGGTGVRFDWRWVPRQRGAPYILAGGLTVDNVAEGVAAVRPYAVDVSGGIESSKGIKDARKMRAFMAEIRRLEHGE